MEVLKWGFTVNFSISRLVHGNKRIFEPSEWNLNLNSKASKIIYNHTKLERISSEPNLKNPLFIFAWAFE